MWFKYYFWCGLILWIWRKLFIQIYYALKWLWKLFCGVDENHGFKYLLILIGNYLCLTKWYLYEFMDCGFYGVLMQIDLYWISRIWRKYCLKYLCLKNIFKHGIVCGIDLIMVIYRFLRMDWNDGFMLWF